MTKKYQTNEFDTSALAVPEQVSVAMTEIAADIREGLLALAVGAGVQVMQQLMEADVTAACGPHGKHDSERVATRHGAERGSVTLGGRRVPITRPRVRATDGTGELPVPVYDLFTSTELLGRMAMERMLAGVSTRRYSVALEPVGAGIEDEAKSTSKSAVSRKFVAMTETAEVDQRHRVDDLDLPRPRQERQALARRADGTALVRRRNGRGIQPVPPRERPPPPRRSPSITGTACRRRNCRSRLQHSRRERSLMLTGRDHSSTELGALLTGKCPIGQI